MKNPKEHLCGRLDKILSNNVLSYIYQVYDDDIERIYGGLESSKYYYSSAYSRYLINNKKISISSNFLFFLFIYLASKRFILSINLVSSTSFLSGYWL